MTRPLPILNCNFVLAQMFAYLSFTHAEALMADSEASLSLMTDDNLL